MMFKLSEVIQNTNSTYSFGTEKCCNKYTPDDLRKHAHCTTLINFK